MLFPVVVTSLRGYYYSSNYGQNGRTQRTKKLIEQHEQNEELDFDDLLQNPPSQEHEEEHPIPQRQPLRRPTRNRRPPHRLMQVFTKEDGV